MKTKYRVGQKVVGLNSNPVVPRQKGKVYTITAVLFCSACGKQFLNFGKKADESFEAHGVCTSCGDRIETKGLIWTSAKHYAEVKDIDAMIQKALDQENYELAAELRDVK
jgi:hypothetical protein